MGAAYNAANFFKSLRKEFDICSGGTTKIIEIPCSMYHMNSFNLEKVSL
jgi:hypothetical protein